MLWRWQGVQVFKGQGRQRVCLHSVLLPQRLPLDETISSRQSSFMLSNCNCNHFVHAMCKQLFIALFYEHYVSDLELSRFRWQILFYVPITFWSISSGNFLNRLPRCNCKIKFANYTVKISRSNIVYIVAYGGVTLKEYEHYCWSINNTQLIMSPLTWSVYTDIRTQQLEDFSLCTLQYSLIVAWSPIPGPISQTDISCLKITGNIATERISTNVPITVN